MTRILALCSPGEVRVAVVVGERLEEFSIWRPGRPDGVGDVYRARVRAHVKALGGAFVALPEGDGFLPDSEGGEGVGDGAVLSVRVTRAAQGGKGPRLTARVPQEPGALGLVSRGAGPLLGFAARYPEAPVLADDPALVASLRPALGERIGLGHGLLEEALAEQIETLARPEVALPGGMTASITPTPALVAIDVDTAAASAGRQTKAAAQREANRLALPELARQIRLRNLSGAILIDLAGMSAKGRGSLAPDLRAALAPDPVGARFLGFTALGLAEIVRTRVRPPLHEVLAGPHAAGLAALRRIAEEGAHAPERRFALRAAPDVLAALETDSFALGELAGRTGRPLIRKSDPAMAPGSWRIETG